MTDSSPTFLKIFSSDSEIAAYQALEAELRTCPIGPGELLQHLGLFLTRPSLARMLFMHDLLSKGPQRAGMPDGIRLPFRPKLGVLQQL